MKARILEFHIGRFPQRNVHCVFGLYEDDLDHPVEWIQCTNEDFKVWNYTEC